MGEYTALILSKFNELENDKDFKNEFVRELFNSQGRDKDYGGTRTRVNAVIRIAKSDKVIEAIEYIVNSVRINREETKAVQMAKETLKKSNLNKQFNTLQGCFFHAFGSGHYKNFEFIKTMSIKRGSKVFNQFLK